VKDNTGATIGQITDLKADPSGQQTAVIKMGSQSFQVAAANLGNSSGAAVINLTQTQINDMLKARGAGPTSGANGGTSGSSGGSMSGGATSGGSSSGGMSGGATGGSESPR
jgi:hypothetical protein